METFIFLTYFIVFLSVSPTNSRASISETFLQCLNAQPTSSAVPNSHTAYIPSNSSFFTILGNQIRNPRFAKPTIPKPLAIVAAATETQVQAAVKCCRKLSLQIRIRSGGHDYEGLSYVSTTAPFVILDMFNFRAITLDLTQSTAWVQAGSTLGELYYEIAGKSNNSYGFPAGICPTVATGGHFSGGGFGNMMRKHGLSVDSIIDAQIVDSRGNVHRDRNSMGKDVFWAIRGGGAASFGVVLAWKIRLVLVPEIVTVFKVERTVEDGVLDLVWKWQQVAYDSDKDLFVRLQLNPKKPGGRNSVIAAFIGMFLGNSDKLIDLMNRTFPELNLRKPDCLEMKWIESVLFWHNFPKGTPAYALLDRSSSNGFNWKRKSDYVISPIPKLGLESIFKTMMELGTSSRKVWMQWNPFGGRMSEIGETETPFPYRKSNLFMIEYFINWGIGEEEHEADYINVLKKFYDSMTPFVSKNPRQAFLNYRDLDIGSVSTNSSYEEGIVYGVKYFKMNFERLVKVKTTFDGDNFFRHEQSIPIAR